MPNPHIVTKDLSDDIVEALLEVLETRGRDHLELSEEPDWSVAVIVESENPRAIANFREEYRKLGEAALKQARKFREVIESEESVLDEALDHGPGPAETLDQGPRMLTEEEYDQALRQLTSLPDYEIQDWQSRQRLRNQIRDMEEYELHHLNIHPAAGRYSAFHYLLQSLSSEDEVAVEAEPEEQEAPNTTLEEEFFSRSPENA